MPHNHTFVPLEIDQKRTRAFKFGYVYGYCDKCKSRNTAGRPIESLEELRQLSLHLNTINKEK